MVRWHSLVVMRRGWLLEDERRLNAGLGGRWNTQVFECVDDLEANKSRLVIEWGLVKRVKAECQICDGMVCQSAASESDFDEVGYWITMRVQRNTRYLVDSSTSLLVHATCRVRMRAPRDPRNGIRSDTEGKKKKETIS